MLRPHPVAILRGLPCSQLALAPRPLRFGVQGGEVATVVPEDVEPTLSLRQTVVVDAIGRELVVDPAHHPCRSHPWYLAGSGPVRQAVQRVERGVLRGEGGSRHCGLWGRGGGGGGAPPRQGGGAAPPPAPNRRTEKK